MTPEINKLMAYLEDHPADFAKQIELKQAIREYGIELDKQQEKELEGAFYERV